MFLIVKVIFKNSLTKSEIENVSSDHEIIGTIEEDNKELNFKIPFIYIENFIFDFLDLSEKIIILGYELRKYKQK